MNEDRIVKQDFFIDMWGFKVNWTNLDDGWTDARRRRVLSLRSKMKKQMTQVPKFTKVGIKKVKVPKNLHEFLMNNRNLSSVTYEGIDVSILSKSLKQY